MTIEHRNAAEAAKPSALTCLAAFEIEGQHPFQHLIVRKVGGPAVSSCNGVVELGMGIREPRGAGVVEVS